MSLPLEHLPNTTQNPLLSSGEFFKYCRPRFRQVVFESDFLRLLARYEESGVLLPVYCHEGKTNYYSIFQVWQVSRLLRQKIERVDLEKEQCREFEKLLLLLIGIQDFYLPEARGDGRVGEFRDYNGDVAIGGTYFLTRSNYIISELRSWRREMIGNGKFKPSEVLCKHGVDAAFVRRWAGRIRHLAKNLDPMENWYPLLRYVNYSKRMKLKFDALLAQDYYEIAEVLEMLLGDLGESCEEPTLLDWADPSFDADGQDSEWQKRFYGRDALGNPGLMLEYLSNDFGLNPKPMAIVFTEGEEWRGIGKIYEFYGFPPPLLGIEFRSIEGEGNFSLANWQCFIEYMHEKQVILYFLLDKEGRAAKEAARLVAAQRKFKTQFLSKVIPQDRIVTWDSSFEEDNFNDAEIAKALTQQGITVTSRLVRATRANPNRKQGLIRAVCSSVAAKVDKPRLVGDLVDLLIARRRIMPSHRRHALRPVETFVESSGRVIMLNHQPTCEEAKTMNLKSGFLG